MTVKKKFSHLGFSIIFYLVFSNLISVIAISICMIIYALIHYFSITASAPELAGADYTLIVTLIEKFRSNTILVNLITMCSGYFIAVWNPTCTNQ